MVTITKHILQSKILISSQQNTFQLWHLPWAMRKTKQNKTKQNKNKTKTKNKNKHKNKQTKNKQTKKKHELSCDTNIFISAKSSLKNQAGYIKGALDNFSLIPRLLFFKKCSDFYTIRSVCLGSNCMLNLMCNFNLITKICEFFLQRPFKKKSSFNMAATVMTGEFRTIHHYSSLEEKSEACLCSSLNRHKINRTLIKLWHSGLE